MEKPLQDRINQATKELSEALMIILKKEDFRLTNTDRAFLRARKAYLTREQIAKYPSVFDDETIDEDTLLYPELGYKELQSKAAELGMKKVVGKERTELEEFIFSHTQDK